MTNIGVARQKNEKTGRFKAYMQRNRNMGGYLLRQDVSRVLGGFFLVVLLFGLCFLILQPLFHQFSSSIMDEADLFDPTVMAIPRYPTWQNYRVVVYLMDYWSTLVRSIGITFGLSILQIAACTLVAYGFARFDFPLKRFWFACVILTIIVPPQVIMAPMFFNFRFFDLFGLLTIFGNEPLNLVGTVRGYTFLSATAMGLRNGLYIFMLRQYFRNMPKELEESAWVDGCGKLRTFAQIMLPDAVPMLISCFLFAFVWQWTDGFFTQIFLGGQRVMAFQLEGLADSFRFFYGRQIAAIAGGHAVAPPEALLQAHISTGVLVSIAPIILIYLIAQRFFVESIGQSGIKM